MIMVQDSWMDDLKQSIDREMETYFNGDLRRIEHARKVTDFVEKLLETESGDRRIVIPAGLLHDIGIPESERKYHSSSGHYQEIEGPPIARTILLRLALDPEWIEKICQIIAHHHTPGKITTQNFKILYDADWLVNLGDEFDIGDKAKLDKTIQKVFLTVSGRKLARQVYISNSK